MRYDLIFFLWSVFSFRLVKVKQSIELVFYNSYKGKGKLRCSPGI
ncbi:hypothetical protein SAMN05421813_104216, partial [Daejeonella rubra]